MERDVNGAVILEQENSGNNYVTMRNLYATERRWNDAEVMEGSLGKNGINKEVGCSVIEEHQCSKSVGSNLSQLLRHMKERKEEVASKLTPTS